MSHYKTCKLCDKHKRHYMSGYCKTCFSEYVKTKWLVKVGRIGNTQILINEHEFIGDIPVVRAYPL